MKQANRSRPAAELASRTPDAGIAFGLEPREGYSRVMVEDAKASGIIGTPNMVGRYQKWGYKVCEGGDVAEGTYIMEIPTEKRDELMKGFLKAADRRIQRRQQDGITKSGATVGNVTEERTVEPDVIHMKPNREEMLT